MFRLLWQRRQAQLGLLTVLLASGAGLFCSDALAFGPLEEAPPLAFVWMLGVGGAGALGGWLFRKSILPVRMRGQLDLIDAASRSANIAMVGLDEQGEVFFANEDAAQLAGRDAKDLDGKRFDEIFMLRSAVNDEPISLARLCEECGENAPVLRAVMRDDKGQEHMLDVRCACSETEHHPVRFLSLDDALIRQNASRELHWQANHDVLTGLVNRRGFEDSLRQAIAAGGEPEKRHSLLFIDLDRFKQINDVGGHAAGDEFLRQLAVVLRARVRTSDVLARMGGDEFAVLLHACPVEHALRIANAIRQDISNFRFVWREKVFQVGASMGLVVLSDPAASAAMVMEQADSACYAAKEAGRDQIRVFHAKAASRQAHSGMNIVESVHDAIEHDRFRIYRQKIVALGAAPAARRHFELLLRMIDDEGKIVPPMVFIPSAERHNMMQAIDRWVLTHALPAIRVECEANPENLPVFNINLSAESINDSRFAQFVCDQIALHRVSPQVICFEITETLAVANLVKAAELIRALKGLGIRFALDDFGAGMCSFAYLKHLPVDYVKIDGAFVRDMFAEPMNLEVVCAINNIAHSLGMETIAEFVESDASVRRLREIGVDYVQGHAVGRPFYFS